MSSKDRSTCITEGQVLNFAGSAVENVIGVTYQWLCLLGAKSSYDVRVSALDGTSIDLEPYCCSSVTRSRAMCGVRH